jgi:large subunit ribosomal protein L35
MPKMKTRRSAAKRFSLTGSGRLKRNKAYKRHMLVHKSSKRRRGLRGSPLVNAANVRQIGRMLGVAVRSPK